MKTKPMLNRKVQLSFGSAIAILFVLGAFSYRSMVAFSESDQSVWRTHEVLESLQQLLFAMQSIESSSRGFVLTGEESYLDTYRADLLSADMHEALVRNLTVDNPEQQRRLPALEGLAAQKIWFAEAVISLRRAKGFEAAVDAIRSGRGERIMNEFQAVVRQLQDEELRLLVQRKADAEQRLGQTKTVLIFGAVVALLITAAAGLSVQRDSSRRGLAEEALRESEERYRMLLDGVQNYAIFMMDPRGQIVSWNAGAERIKGYTGDQIIGRNFSCFFLPEDIERGRPEQILRMIAASGRHEEQLMRVRRDGTRYLASVALTALRDAAGNLRGIAEISHDLSDITERKQTEEKYRTLFNSIDEGYCTIEVLFDESDKPIDYRFLELNPSFVKQTGIQNALGKRIREIAPLHEEYWFEIYGKIALTGEPARFEHFAAQLHRWFDVYAFRVGTPREGKVAVLFRDITKRKEAEALLLQKVEELNRSNKELGQFAYVASHDLQEPLRMVASYTQLLSRRYKGKLDSDADEFIAFAADGASRMQRLIQDLLTYSRVGTKEKDLRDTSSEETLQQALVNLRGAIEESGALVTHDPLPTVLADEMQLIQLFQNLVGNAIKYQNPGVPRVHISAAKNGGGKWIFSVQDNGLGIDSQYFERIFGMFQRLHKREEFSGTGIGLAICKKIVERHGGSISVESQPGEGSTFRFALAGSERNS